MMLKTKRLVLRPIRDSDAKDIVKQISNLKISKWLLVVPYPYTMKDAKIWVAKCKKNAKKHPITDYNFVISLKGRHIGDINLRKVDRFQGTAELGYWLSEDYWRQGYMSEAAKKVLELAKKLKLRRVQAGVFRGNKASAGLLKSLGFKCEGCLRKVARCRATGKVGDEYIFGKLI